MNQYRISKRKNFPILLVGASASILIFYGLATQGYNLNLVVLLLIFGSLTALGFFSYLINIFKPILVFDASGISGFAIGTKIIPWKNIRSITLHKQGISLYQQKYLKIAVINQISIKIYLSYLNDSADNIFNSACENHKAYSAIVS